MNNQITYFSADFRAGKVTIAKTFVPAGWFVTWMLNNYYADDTAARLSVFKNGIWALQNELLAGICRQETMHAALEDIRNITTTLSKTEPFARLDLVGEQTRLDELFSDKNYEEINELLTFRRKYIPDENLPQLLRNTPGYLETARLRKYENRLSALSETLAYYDSVGNDMTAMRKLLIRFVDQLSGLKKLDENSLLRLALPLFPESDRQTASTALEYIGIRKKPQSKTAVTARRMIFSRYRDFLTADLFEGIANGHFPQKCGICGRYFLMQNARHQRYCDGLDPNDPKERTCRKVAASLSREARERYEDHPVKQVCVKRLNTIRKHLSNGKITEEYAEAAKQLSQNLRDRALFEAEYYTSGQYEKDMTQEAIYKAIDKKLK